MPSSPSKPGLLGIRSLMELASLTLVHAKAKELSVCSTHFL